MTWVQNSIVQNYPTLVQEHLSDIKRVCTRGEARRTIICQIWLYIFIVLGYLSEPSPLGTIRISTAYYAIFIFRDMSLSRQISGTNLKIMISGNYFEGLCRSHKKACYRSSCTSCVPNCRHSQKGLFLCARLHGLVW